MIDEEMLAIQQDEEEFLAAMDSGLDDEEFEEDYPDDLPEGDDLNDLPYGFDEALF